MRYASDHREKTRDRVVQEAAREIRAKGPDGVGVAGIMAKAGLTHGGFYAHFESKSALVCDAVDAMFDQIADRIADLGAGQDATNALREVLSYYFSKAHRDDIQDGCPMVALSGDMARFDGAARMRFNERVADIRAGLRNALTAIGVERSDAEANVLLAHMIGTVTLARALGPGKASDKVLRDGFKHAVIQYGLEKQ